MVRSIASLIDGARVPSTEVQAPQPWVVIRSSVIQSRPGRLTFIPSGIFVLLHWSHLPESNQRPQDTAGVSVSSSGYCESQYPDEDTICDLRGYAVGASVVAHPGVAANIFSATLCRGGGVQLDDLDTRVDEDST
jgi:hypothetical protein